MELVHVLVNNFLTEELPGLVQVVEFVLVSVSYILTEELPGLVRVVELVRVLVEPFRVRMKCGVLVFTFCHFNSYFSVKLAVAVFII